MSLKRFYKNSAIAILRNYNWIKIENLLIFLFFVVYSGGQ